MGYLTRLKRHIRREDSGMAGGRNKRLLVDVLVKALLDLLSFLITRALSGVLDDYEWRHRDLDWKRRRLLTRIEKSDYQFNNTLPRLINLAALLRTTTHRITAIGRTYNTRSNSGQRCDR